MIGSGADTEHEPIALSSVLREVLARMAPAITATTQVVDSGVTQQEERATRPVPIAEAADGLQSVEQLWQQVVGDPLAELTRVTRYRGGVLFVDVAAAPLLAELRSFARKDLLRGLHDGGLSGVSDIKFQASGSHQRCETTAGSTSGVTSGSHRGSEGERK
ncbi:MAG: DUF721 domain-containing protein [Planctomycetota bacterium]